MLRKANIINGGDTKFIQGDQVEYSELVEENIKVSDQNKEPAKFERVLLGITKASLTTNSFIFCRILPGDNKSFNRSICYWKKRRAERLERECGCR